MTTECTQVVFGFHPLKRHEIRAQFDGGGLLLREALDGTFQFAYILTKLGWDIINHAYVIMYTAIIFSAGSLILSAVGLILALHKSK